MSAVLELSGITAGYGRTTVLRDVDVTVEAGTVVALLGPNGAGKTTLLRTAAGLMRPSAGVIRQEGDDVTRRDAVRRARAGLCLVPEGRGIFRSLTVKENLLLQVPPWHKDGGLERAYETFPVLKERNRQVAGTMSGGQQQMLALARAYLADPKLVLLDEGDGAGPAHRGGDLHLPAGARRARRRAPARGAVRPSGAGHGRPRVPAQSRTGDLCRPRRGTRPGRTRERIPRSSVMTAPDANHAAPSSMTNRRNG